MGLIAPAIFLAAARIRRLDGGDRRLGAQASGVRLSRLALQGPCRRSEWPSICLPRSCDNAILRAKFSRPSAIWLAIQLGGSTSRSPRVCFPATPQSCVHALRLLRAAGIRIAIDDFGTASPRSAACRSCRLTLFKIDRVFTSRLPSEPQELHAGLPIIVHAFDMTTVAEGVETQAQLALPGARRLR